VLWVPKKSSYVQLSLKEFKKHTKRVISLGQILVKDSFLIRPRIQDAHDLGNTLISLEIDKN
jgi:hypothetical protein